MTIFPSFEARLAQAAEELAERQGPAPQRSLAHRPRRRGWHAGPLVAVLVIATMGGVAYAARGLWQPPLGDGDPDRVQVAVAGDPDEGFTATLGVLRRPQTEADRGPASRYALKFPHQQAGILTDDVRVLGTVQSSGAAVVLVPTRDLDVAATTPAASSVPAAPAPDQLCLWVADTTVQEGDGGGRTCARPGDIERGKLSLATITPPKESEDEMAAMRAGRAAAMREAERKNECFLNYPPMGPEELARARAASAKARRDAKGRCLGIVLPPQNIPNGAAVWIAVVPDGVATVRLGEGRGALKGNVEGNLVVIESDERTLFSALRSPADQHWLDAGGDEVGPRR